ncbi:MAG: helix-turn-helix domain-containing protein [Solirubrobacterales bacterium]|nr:helix-turn-helix domain-containing protein [Solirubrobacterales bacterium]
MLAKPASLVGRELEWSALARFVERGQRLAVVYGPRRVGKSFLIEQLCEAAGGFRYQAVAGLPASQLADLGRELGERIGSGPLQLSGWADALDRLALVDAPVVAIDELPYLTETVPELASLLQRYVDAGRGPALILAGSSLSVMSELVEARAPLYGRAGSVVVPAPLTGPDLAELWGAPDPGATLWIDAALGGLPGYRPLVAAPRRDLDAWMVDEVLAPGSPLLDAAEADLAGTDDPTPLRGAYRAILDAIAGGERGFSAISRVAGLPSGALSRPLAALQRAGLVERIPDPLRSRRDRYELANPHLRLWLSVVARHSARLQAGRAADVWREVGETTWRAQVLGPRWEAVVRAHVERGDAQAVGAVEAVGVTAVSDPSRRRSHELDLVATAGGRTVAIGEAKLRRLGRDDLDRLLALRELLGAPGAQLVLASAEAVDRPAASHPDVVAITPADIYGQ